ncbi:MAG: tRNA (guanosine(37)-N1)-methyltransferase TrmD [Bdellovibrionaceae bacterium]|nr:tRNA (guanosine(37)-N1)-methyltransferase TrmD [Pseudobdellovibrionaceae bacterium]
MLFSFLTIFPDLISQSLNYGVIGQAIKAGTIRCQSIQLREFALDRHRSVDDKPFGGSDGMLMKPEVLGKALETVRHTKILFPSPQGALLTQQKAKALSQEKEIAFLCGRYAGIDERVLVSFDIEEISIGDYVVSGGEWPALIMMDAIARHIPGVLGNQVSLCEDSFASGILESPAFTRPQLWNGLKVPDLVVGGDHEKIRQFNEWMSVLITLKKRPELLSRLDPESALGKKWNNKMGLFKFYNQLSDEDKKSCAVENLEGRIRDY